MLRTERDYILRMIAVAAAAIARLREKLAKQGEVADVVAEVRVVQGELLGKDASLLRALDPASAAQLMDPQHAKAWADLLRLEADAMRASGSGDEAAAVEQRAAVLEARAKKT
jgi:hypothetical protein